jgi:hypothetical protein
VYFCAFASRARMSLSICENHHNAYMGHISDIFSFLLWVDFYRRLSLFATA